MGARVMDGRGLAAGIEEELAAVGADPKRAGTVPGFAPLEDIEAVHPVNTGDVARTDTIFVSRVAWGKGSSDD